MTPNLNRRWSEGKYLVPGALGVAVHVDEDVDAVLVDLVSCLTVTLNRQKQLY